MVLTKATRAALPWIDHRVLASYVGTLHRPTLDLTMLQQDQITKCSKWFSPVVNRSLLASKLALQVKFYSSLNMGMKVGFSPYEKNIN
jgi:hypothetical protein